MSSKKLYFIFIGIIGLLLVGLIAGAYGVNSLLAEQANSLTSLKAKNLALENQKVTLAKAKKDVIKYAELEKITKTIVPEDKSQAEAVREIVNLAAKNDIKIATISFPASTLGSAITKPGTNNITKPNPSSGKTAALSQLQPVKNIAGVYQLQIQIDSDPNTPIPYYKFINFLNDIEHNRRTAQVSAISIAPQATNPNLLTFNLTLNGYIKP